jgi:arylsulfatase A-like enzyme
MSDGAGRPLHRGLGVLAGVVSFGVAGLADGAVAWLRAPPGSLPPRLGLLVLAHCVAVLLTFGVFLGAAEELALAALARVPFMPRFARWCADGPGRWFARDPMTFATLLAVALALGVTFGPTFPVAYLVITTFHAMPLAALAVLLVQIASAALGATLALLLLPLLRGAARRLGPFASPGVFGVLGTAAVSAHAVHFVRLNWASFHNLEFAFAAVGLALLLGNAAALLVLGRGVLRASRPVRGGVVLGAAGVAVAAFAVSAVTFGARQTVAATIFNRSVLTQRVARSLQVALDADRDGFSALFNGGDCDDRDPAVNPRARDIPGNGRDENCSGRDARVETEESDGGMVPLPARFGDRAASVVFLSIDAMRPDHMSAYGYHRPTTPNLDRFARAGARFEHAHCASPRSLRSFASIMVGRYASMVEWGNDVQFPPLQESNVTLAERLRLVGYRTAAMHNTSYFSHTAGYFQGFDTVHEAYGFKAEVQDTVDRIQGFLRERRADGQPFFLWSHLMEPHDPYRDHTAPRDFGHSDIDRYDEEIARADAALAPVLSALEAMARERPVVVFLFADHGEAFGEHGVFHHSFDLHDEALRVPLIVWGTGVAPGPRAALTSLLDLHPTALNLARAPVSGPVSGRSLVPILADGARRAITFPGWRARLYGEVTPDGIYPSEQRSLTEPPYKLIQDVRRGTWELFDLARDPGELRNLYDERPDLAATLRERLLTWADHASLASNRTQDIIAAARLTRPPKPQHPLGVRFGDLLELIGYDLPADRLRINDAYRAVFYYRVLQRTRSPVVVTVNFEPEDGQAIWPFFRARHHPLGGRYPTTDWRPGEILRDEVSLRVDPEMRPVRLRSFFALEIEANNTRIAPRTGDDGRAQLPLAPIEIVP